MNQPSTPEPRVTVVARRQDGSIAIFMSVMLITTGLIVATLFSVMSGLQNSRKAGDSANALQVADAGVNDAVKAIPTVATSTFTRTGTLGSGTFTYTATRDTNDPSVWHINGVGVDKTGAKRRILADASGQSIFQAPLYVNKGLDASSGVFLDSFVSGQDLAHGCTQHGIMFFSPGASGQVKFGANGGGNANCTQKVYGGSWTYVMDGCYVFGADGSQTLPPQGSGACPTATDPNWPNRTKKILQDFQPPTVSLTANGQSPSLCSPVNQPSSDPNVVCINMPSSSPAAIGNSFTCDPNWKGSAATGATSLKAGFTYWYNIVTLNGGCQIDPTSINGGSVATTGDWVSANPVHIYANVVNIATGTKGVVNPPPTTTFPSICTSSSFAPPAVSTWTYLDQSSPQNPASYYCSGWSKSLQINILDGTSTNSTITGNGGKFWGTWLGPSAGLTLNSPGMEFWGAMMSGNVSVKNQFSWHYDDSLTTIRSQRYAVNNWREEPLG